MYNTKLSQNNAFKILLKTLCNLKTLQQITIIFKISSMTILQKHYLIWNNLQSNSISAPSLQRRGLTFFSQMIHLTRIEREGLII